jgi:hypothetical protein
MSKEEWELFVHSVHVEMRKGTQEQAIAYCSKEASSLIADLYPHPVRMQAYLGHPLVTSQGKRSDLAAVAAHIVASVNDNALQPLPVETALLTGWTRDVCAKHHAWSLSVLRMAQARARCRIEYTQNFLFVGGTGVGKSTAIAAFIKKYDLRPYVCNGPSKQGDSVWWPDAAGKTIVIYDDNKPVTGKGQAGSESLLVLLNRTEHPALSVKGGHVNRSFTLNIFLSNIEPSQWVDGIPAQHVAAIERRFSPNQYWNPVDAGCLGMRVNVNSFEDSGLIEWQLTASLSIYHMERFFQHFMRVYESIHYLREEDGVGEPPVVHHHQEGDDYDWIEEQAVVEVDDDWVEDWDPDLVYYEE